MDHFRFWREMGQPPNHLQCNMTCHGCPKLNGDRNGHEGVEIG